MERSELQESSGAGIVGSVSCYEVIEKLMTLT